MATIPTITRVTKVLSVHQSPMNRIRWCLALECGHEQWITAKRRPQARTARCHELHESSPDKEGQS